MRTALTCATLLAAPWSLPSEAVERTETTAVSVLQVRSDDPQSLRDSLLALAEDRLRPTGLSIDHQRARLSVSAALPVAQIFEVRPIWLADADSPSLPLRFELRPVADSSGPVAVKFPIQATLAVALQKEVFVAARGLSKGSAVSCADFAIERRDLRQLPKLPLARPCEIPAGFVALRDIATHDLIRGVDIGKAPDVTAGAPVRVTVSTGGISITASATALADGRAGDQIEVRMQRPARTLRTRVTGPGAVQLTDGN